MTEDKSLERALADSRVAPDYTMGAVAQRTGVPPDTLRSWERRYGFPDPVRTGTNRRLYSERDIVAVGWLRDQTERGQGISEAITMLRSRMPRPNPDTAKTQVPEPAPAAPSHPLPLKQLKAMLLDGHLDVAQDAWDDLVIALSPEAIGVALLELYQGLRDQTPADMTFTTERARAFLLRKATVLLDHAGPDHGQQTILIITSGDRNDLIPATVLAARLARSGNRVVTPFPDVSSLTAVDAVHHAHPDIVVLVGASEDQVASFSRLVPGVDVHHWNVTGDVDRTTALSSVLNKLRHNR